MYVAALELCEGVAVGMSQQDRVDPVETAGLPLEVTRGVQQDRGAIANQQ